MAMIIMILIESISGFLNPGKGTNLDALLSEDVVLQGLNIFVRNTLKDRIIPAVKEISEAGDATSQKDKDLHDLIKAFFALVTNFTSHGRSAESFLKFEGMIEDFRPLWLDLKYNHIFPLSVKSLYNLSVEDEARKVLLDKCPPAVKDSVRLISSLIEEPEKIEPYATFIANMTTMREARRWVSGYKSKSVHSLAGDNLMSIISLYCLADFCWTLMIMKCSRIYSDCWNRHNQ